MTDIVEEIQKIQNLRSEVHNHMNRLQTAILFSSKSPSYQDMKEKVILEIQTTFNNLEGLE